MECSDGRLHSFNNSCFLVVSFPQATWQTASQVCKGLKVRVFASGAASPPCAAGSRCGRCKGYFLVLQAELAEVYSSAEQDFIVERIRHSPDYTTTNTYWLGGALGMEGRWHWLSGQDMTFTGTSQVARCCSGRCLGGG